LKHEKFSSDLPPAFPFTRICVANGERESTTFSSRLEEYLSNIRIFFRLIGNKLRKILDDRTVFKGYVHHITSVTDPDPGSDAFFNPWIRNTDPGPGIGKNPEPGSGIRDKHPRSYFENLISFSWVKKNLKFFDADLGSCQP
jgi:hypothetical protein